jgi:F-type H+-transporting ATPase subunit b
LSLIDLFTAAQAWGSSAAGAEDHTVSVTQLIFPTLNFLIFVYIIKRFAVPLIREYLRSRRERIVASFADAAERKKNVEAVVQDYRSRLAGLDAEMRSIQESYRAEGETERAKLLRQGELLAARIKEDARFLANQEIKLARQKIREEMASRAEATAQELVQRHLSAADQRRLVEDFLRDIGNVR